MRKTSKARRRSKPKTSNEATKLKLGPAGFLAEFLENATRLLHVSIMGLHKLEASPALVEAVIELQCLEEHREMGDDEHREVQSTREAAEFAKKEREKDFPMLRAQTLVSVWGAFEAFVDDFIVETLLGNPKALEKTEFSKIKIPFVEFTSLDEEDKMRFVVGELKQALRVEFKPGVGKFEPLLAVFGLDGPVGKKVKRDLYEFYHVRNVIVHRASIADRRFLSACPWIRYRPGESIRIDRRLYDRYTLALSKYISIIVRRITKSREKKQREAPKKKGRPKESAVRRVKPDQAEA